MKISITGSTGFSQFWAMDVTGFNTNQHCQKCLKGKHLKQVFKNMGHAEFEYDPAGYLYICGYCSKNDENNGLHILVKKCLGKTYSIQTNFGDTITITDSLFIEPDIELAKKMFPNLSEDYVGCRCFQYGCQLFLKNSKNSANGT